MHTKEKFLGAGRSAEVYLVTTQKGQVARKVFTSSKLPDLLHVGFYGAPNPYRWYEPAVKAAFYRRRILHKLLKHWFGNELTIAEALGWGYDEGREAYYLDTEFVPGHKAGFATPFSEYFPLDLDCLKLIMRKLDHVLEQAGFDGARWQAGYGQPCAYANFLAVEEYGVRRWVWIDAESAVPQIASSSLLAQSQHYIPKWRELGKPLFDNVDTDKLENYLRGLRNELLGILSVDEVEELFDDLEELKEAEAAWRAMGKVQANLAHYSSKNPMSPSDLEYFKQFPGAWRPIMNRLAIKEGLNLAKIYLPQLARKVAAKLNPLPYLKFLLPKHRKELAEEFLAEGVKEWQDDHRFSEDSMANSARAALIELDVSHNRYMTDFGAHLSIWMLGKFATILLMVAGLIALHITGHDLSSAEKWWSGFALVWGDSLARFLYSVIRGLEDKLEGKVFPWVAVIFSPIKWIGYFSYPLQMIMTARGQHESEFLVYLICSYLAKKIPIYGSENSGAEYRMNQLGWSLIKAPIWLLLAWCYSMLTATLLALMYLTMHSAVSLVGLAIAIGLGLYAWHRINRHT